MQIVAWIAAALVFASFFMKTIVPLRTLAIASNVAFIGYALFGLYHDVFDKVLPILVLHVALLPLNLMRLRQVKQTIRAVKEAAGKQPSLDELIPYMSAVVVPRGHTLFKYGDPAEHLYLLRKGRVKLTEFNKLLGPGDLFGEVGVFARDARRTASAVCEDDCELLRISSDKVLELFYLDPGFGIHIVRMLSGYLGGAGPSATPAAQGPTQTPAT